MPPEPSLPPGAEPSTAVVSTLFVATFLATFLLFLGGQSLQLLNLPFGLVATSLLVFGAAGLVFPRALNLKALDFTGARRFPGGLVALAFLVGLANMGFANFLMGALRELLPHEWSELADSTTRLLVRADPTTRVIIVLAAGVAAPIGEELFFRGWLQGLLGRRFGRTVSIATVALLFSFTHLDPVGFLPRVELGLLFGLMRAWTGSLYPSMAAHAAHNLVSTAVLYLSADPLAELDQPFEWGLSAALGAGSLVATVALCAFIHRLAPRSRLSEPEPMAPAVSGVPAFRLLPRRLLAGFTVGGLLLVGSGGVLLVLAEKLPGADLTRDMRQRLFRPPNGSKPANRPNP